MSSGVFSPLHHHKKNQEKITLGNPRAPFPRCHSPKLREGPAAARSRDLERDRGKRFVPVPAEGDTRGARAPNSLGIAPGNTRTPKPTAKAGEEEPLPWA